MVCHVTKRLGARDAIQREFDGFERWTHVNLMKINKAKHKGQSQAQVQDRQRMDWALRKGLGVIGGWEAQHDPAMRTPSPDSQTYLGLHQKKYGEDAWKTYWGKWFSTSTLLSWHPGVLLAALGSQHKKAVDLLRGSPEEGHKDDHKGFPYKETTNSPEELWSILAWCLFLPFICCWPLPETTHWFGGPLIWPDRMCSTTMFSDV